MCQDSGVNELPPFAVVIVTWGHSRTLTACLTAVARLEPAPASVVVVDNGSADDSPTAAAAFARELPLRLICGTTNAGFAAAANTGIALTDQPWILLLNPDCAPQPAYVAEMLAAAQNRPEEDRIGAITGKLMRANGPELVAGPVVDAAGMVVTPAGRHLDRGAGMPDDQALSQPAFVFGGTGAATLYRRAALVDVAYPDGQVFAAAFFAYREDAELAWRLQWRGWQCLYVPTALAAHERGLKPERGRAGQRLINALSVRNRFLLRLHCADIGWHLRCFPWWLLRDILVVGAAMTVERSSLSALTAAWRLRGEAWQRRKWVLGRSTVASRQVARWFRIKGWVRWVKKEAEKQ